MDKFFNRLMKGLFLFGFGGIVITGYFIISPKYKHAADLSDEKARLERRIEEKQREISAIKAKQQRFRTDREFVETLARRNHRVFPGELVFVFEE